MRNPLNFLVGMARFERAASASRTLRSSQAEPHPVKKSTLRRTNIFGKAFFCLSNQPSWRNMADVFSERGKTSFRSERFYDPCPCCG